MFKHLISLGAILFGAAFAWAILFGMLQQRTSDSDRDQRAALDTLWGTEQSQAAPAFDLDVPVPPGAKKGTLPRTFGLEPDASTIAVNLALEQRQKGLLWYATYGVAFDATYLVVNDGPSGVMRIMMPFAAHSASFDDVIVSINGKRLNQHAGGEGLTASVDLPANARALVRVAYKSHGVGSWTYSFGSATAGIRNFKLTLDTNFQAIDFPAETLAPTSKLTTPIGWHLTWQFRDLVTSYGIGMTLPERLQPGPLAQRITQWAPLALLFYFFVLFVVTEIRKIDLHPVNYFFLAAAFFAFHLLFAYTVDRVTIGVAFALASAVSMFLTISYLRLVAGLRFAAVEAALAQFFYLILFSLALFNEGYSGLSITIGAIVTLFLTMQWTGRIKWSERDLRAPVQTAPHVPAS